MRNANLSSGLENGLKSNTHLKICARARLDIIRGKTLPYFYQS